MQGGEEGVSKRGEGGGRGEAWRRWERAEAPQPNFDSVEEDEPCPLNASNISTFCPSKKLDWKRLGTYKVVKRIGLQAYQLDLPPTMRRLHNVFHVSLLDRVRPTSLAPHLPPAPPALYVKDDQEYFEIEDILDFHRDCRRLKYLIKWKGVSESDNSWEPFSNIPACGLVKDYHRRNPGKPGEPRRLHFVGFLP
jgi:hypothetical protein